jgi:hypothetical protein
MNETSKTKSGWRIPRRIMIGLAILATLAAIFYAEEDWRGKRAWEKCKRELEAKGIVLDWDKFIPPSVPDDQNFFTASTNILLRFHKAQTPEQSDAAAQSSWLRLPPFGSNSFPILDTAKTKPLVVAAITVIPPGSATLEPASNRIILKFNDPAARNKAGVFIQNTIGRSANGAAGFKFSELQLSNFTPAQIILQADPTPSAGGLENLISEDAVTNIGHLRVEATSDKEVFQVLLTGVRVTAAADYLKWSDQFEPAFDEIREALKRPYAIIPGDYSRPYSIPIPNFVTMRSVAQTLAQRAQCYLLLGEPDQALREVTLMHDVCRILEKPPTGKPMTLVEAMINVAITGLYVNTIADGLQKNAWREPQLAALQKQLAEINLAPFVAQAFEAEPAGLCRTLETASLGKIMSVTSGSGSHRSVWQNIRDVIFNKYNLVPRGWVHQNMALIARLGQPRGEGFDLANNLILPGKFKDLARQMDAAFSGNAKPYNFLAAIGNPNIIKATQTLAHNQTLVNEAQIACALERYRLAHGEYPETLDALKPEFIEKLPHDIIGGQPLFYRRTGDGKFLLYSVGWNETDDGGITSDKMDQGDWVWKN